MPTSSVVLEREEVATEETCDECCREKNHTKHGDRHHGRPVLTCFECNGSALLGDGSTVGGNVEVDFAIAVGEEIIRLCSKSQRMEKGKALPWRLY